MSARNFLLLGAAICSLSIVLTFSNVVLAESMAPVQEQEFSDAKASIENARSIQTEQFAPDFMQKAQELMKTAANARQAKDQVLFSRASRLARTYAELAKASAELQIDAGKLATAKGSLDKIKTEIEQLKQVP
jgi:flagellar hook-basal body complex protein FliE